MPGDLERFESKVRRDPETGCLEWTGSRDAKGYGHFGFDRKVWKSHRWIFWHTYGRLPEVVMHVCDNPSCVEITHLQAGTFAANNADRERKGRGRQPRGERHGSAKLTDAQCREVRSAHAGGVLTYGMLAEAYGVSVSQISNIVSGKRKEGARGCPGR